MSAVTAVADTSRNQEDEPKTHLGDNIELKKESVIMGEYERTVCAECTINGFLRLSELSEHEAKL